MSDSPNSKSLGQRCLRVVLRPDVGPVLALIAVFLAFYAADLTWGQGKFGTMRNIRTNLATASMIAVPALGMTLIIIAGGIDLSAGTALSLCAAVLAYCLESEHSAVVAVLAALLTGLCCGLLNGILISGTRIVPFVVTLGTMSIYLGIGSIVTDERSIEPSRELIPSWLSALCSTRGGDYVLGFVPNMPLGVWAAVGLAAFTGVLLKMTVFGRMIFAVGSNEQTARLCGINVSLTKIMVYGIAGIFIGAGALYSFSYIKQATAQDGVGLELEIIAAVVIGGGSLSGGRGSVVGTLAGAALTKFINSGCTQLGVDAPYQKIILGSIVIMAVALDQLRHQPPQWMITLWYQLRGRMSL